MTVPAWASSMTRNYKSMFKEKYGRETTLSDEAVFDICETVHDDDSSEAQDTARVEVMMKREG